MMRFAFLALAAIALLTTGAALSFHALQTPVASVPVAEAVAEAPAPTAATATNEAAVTQSAVEPVNEPIAPSVVRVKTVRIEPVLPATAPEGEPQAAAASEAPQPEANAGDQSATLPAPQRTSALKAVTPDAEDSPAPRARTARARQPVAAAKTTSQRKRKPEEAAGDDAAKQPLSYAPKEAGPESLNPLGKLLGGR
ncbi:MAG: hypothetical protein JOZ16_16275 [Methylobacteriaceae bacterium]|nr:hypothetical protein [Methylobacteriaceae bacterium]